MLTAAARLRRSLLLAFVLALIVPWQVLAADPTPAPESPAPTEAAANTETPAAIESPAPTEPPLATPTEPPATEAPATTEPPAVTATEAPAGSEPPAATEPPPPADPTATPTPTPAAPAVQTINVDLYRTGAAVHQFTSTWCVPANAQKMLNLINGTTDRRYATQLRYSRQIRKLNKYDYPTPGNDVRGWARFLDAHVGGPWHYGDRSFRSRGVAIAAIAESIDRTGHPVGIVVWHGSHAWTVVGYRATVTAGVAGRKIVGLYVSGSLRRDPFAQRYMSLTQFATHYTRYHEATRPVVWEGKYVIVSE